MRDNLDLQGVAIMPGSANNFACFMASPTGRGVRVVAGLAIIVWGWSMRAQTGGIVLMIVGLVPLAAGVFNVCLIAPIIGAPFSGAKARTMGDGGRPGM